MSPETVELQALHWVSQRGITVADGGYVRDGQPVTGELAQALVRLRAAGYLAVGQPGPDRNRPVQATTAGKVRLTELGQGTLHEG